MNLPIRPMQAGDRSYIIKTWVLSLRSQFPFSEMCSDAIAKYSKRVESLLDTADVLVACDTERPDLVYGFICYEQGKYLGVDAPTLHFIHVRYKFRENGIASQMFYTAFPKHEDVTYTHITKALHYAKLKEKWKLRHYDPYYIEGALYSQARKLDAKAMYRDGLEAEVP